MRSRSLIPSLMILFSAPAYPFAVATATNWSTEAAIEILRKGGSAVDATIAATFALNVANSQNAGIGGGGLLLVEKDGRIYSSNHREAAPAAATPKMFLGSDGKPLPYIPDRVTGPTPVGVPGTVLGLWQAHKKYGKLPWKSLLEPAIRLARQGVPVTARFERNLTEEWPRISAFAATAALYGDGSPSPKLGARGGGHLATGHTFRNPWLARTLETLAEKGGPAFYSGELARSWLSSAQKLGVKISEEDLRGYKIREDKPVAFRVFGLHGVTVAPPSAAGIMVAASLRYLENYYKSHDIPEPDSASRIIVTAETLRHMQELRDANIADPPHGRIDPAAFLGSADEKLAWAEIDRAVTRRLDRIETKVTASKPKRSYLDPLSPEREALHHLTARFEAHGVTVPGKADHGHTSHISVLDDHGMAVSYTTTIEQWFGSGITVPGMGFLLNNELSDFSPEPGHPNAPAAGKRPRSNMSPTLLFEDAAMRRPVGIVGCAGGGQIPTAVVESLENYFLHKMSAREALAFPRFHPGPGDALLVEDSVPSPVIRQLKTAGFEVELEKGSSSSSAQALLRRSADEAWEAASEPRGEGLGLAWEPRPRD